MTKVQITNIHPRGYTISRVGKAFKKGAVTELELRPNQIKALQRARYLKVEIVQEGITQDTQIAISKGRGWYRYEGKNVRKADLPDGTIIEEKKEE